LELSRIRLHQKTGANKNGLGGIIDKHVMSPIAEMNTEFYALIATGFATTPTTIRVEPANISVFAFEFRKSTLFLRIA